VKNHTLLPEKMGKYQKYFRARHFLIDSFITEAILAE
jgi:hypothetical protein